MMLKAIPARSNYPFDPDNPVPKGVQLAPADLRAKYYKVIDSDAKFYIGDPRLQRDRRMERDPARTNKFKKLRADLQEVFDDTRRYVIDELVRGRWYDKAHASESTIVPDFATMMEKPAFRYDHDMFSILSNKYGREFKGRQEPPKTDFITKNKRNAKLVASLKASKMQQGQQRGLRGSRARSVDSMETICDTLFDSGTAPAMLKWLNTRASESDKSTFQRAFKVLSATDRNQKSVHQSAIAEAQIRKKMMNAGVINQAMDSKGRPDLTAHHIEPFNLSNPQLSTTEQPPSSDPQPEGLEAELAQEQASSPRSNQPPHHQDPASFKPVAQERKSETEAKHRPTTAYVNTLPMPPLPGEVPPVERRQKGVFPANWRPSQRVMELKTKLQEILSSKHRHLKISFRRFDEDHKGTIDLSELHRVMVQESAIPCTRKELEELWDLFDRDRDGIIRYSDYAKTMGNDALDERDYFQIAQRKAAGRYNEAVTFFKDELEQDKMHFMNKDADNPREYDARIEHAAFEANEAEGHKTLFTLPDAKFGAIFNEQCNRPSDTVEGTNAHQLRIEISNKLKERYGSVEQAFQIINANKKGKGLISDFAMKKTLKELGIDFKDLTVVELFSSFDRDRDGNLGHAEFLRAFENPERAVRRAYVGKDDENDDGISFYNIPSEDSTSQFRRTYRDDVVGKSSARPAQPNRAKAGDPKGLGKLIPAKPDPFRQRAKEISRSLPRGAARAKDDSNYMYDDRQEFKQSQNIGTMMPPRPMSALSGGLDFSSVGHEIHKRASTPLQQMRSKDIQPAWEQGKSVEERSGPSHRESRTPPIAVGPGLVQPGASVSAAAARPQQQRLSRPTTATGLVPTRVGQLNHTAKSVPSYDFGPSAEPGTQPRLRPMSAMPRA